jgi:hypothetical protein
VEKRSRPRGRQGGRAHATTVDKAFIYDQSRAKEGKHSQPSNKYSHEAFEASLYRVQCIGTTAHDTAGPHIIRRAAAEAGAAAPLSLSLSWVPVSRSRSFQQKSRTVPDLTSPVHAMMEREAGSNPIRFRSRPALARARPQIKRFRSCACLQRSAGACSFDRSIKAEKLRRSGSFRHTTPAARRHGCTPVACERRTGRLADYLREPRDQRAACYNSAVF